MWTRSVLSIRSTSGLAALAIFAGLGFGLALPFLLLGFVPALRRRLPKPGAWMGRFRRLMSVPMFLTALDAQWGTVAGTIQDPRPAELVEPS